MGGLPHSRLAEVQLSGPLPSLPLRRCRRRAASRTALARMGSAAHNPPSPAPCPQNFWSRLAGRFGTKFYWQDQGQDAAIVNAVAAIDNCIREPIGRGQCSAIRGELE